LNSAFIARLAAFAKAPARFRDRGLAEAFGVGGTGRSSIPETPVHEPTGRGVLDRRFPWATTMKM
jgi:hypothetical protein